MPTLKSINAKAGTNFRRTTELIDALKPKEEPLRHYQIKVTEYGQVCLRAPNDAHIVGMLWRTNRFGLRSGGGGFGQAVLFPSQMRPGQNSDIDYRLPDGDSFAYFTAKLPEITGEWQWIDAQPSERYDTFWHGMDEVTFIPVSEYDTWLLTGEPMPGSEAVADAPDVDYARSVQERRQAIEAKQPYLSVANAAAEMGFTPEFLGQIEAGEVPVEDWHKDNIERVLNAWAWVLEE